MSLLDQEAFLINISDMTRFNHFNLIAPIYDKLFKPSDPRKLQSLLGLEKHINLLDVGGGTGRGSHNLHEFINKLVIADSSMGMLAQAQKKVSTMPILSMSEELSLKSESFERVIIVDALHHVNDYRETIAELWRVTASGGLIVIIEPDIQKIPVKILALIEKFLLMRSHFISPQRIKENFGYSNASTLIERNGSSAWIIVNKK